MTRKSDADLIELIRGFRRIVTVGASTNPSKAAHQIPRNLLSAGFDVVPANPAAEEIFGRRSFPAVAEVPGPIDVVQVFRPAEEAPAIAEDAVRVGARVLWLQLGIHSTEARRIAEDAGLVYVENLCLGETVKRLGVEPEHRVPLEFEPWDGPPTE